MDKKNTRKLSKAIQKCIADLVDTMPFGDSEVPDTLIQDGCLTEDECKEIRTKTNRKDQVRLLILLVKGRSFNVMKKYLDAIKTHCPAAVEKVWDQYNILLRTSSGPWQCPMCELKDCVDVKYVMDTLYGQEIISTSLYSMVCSCTSSLAQQDNIWDSVLKSCAGTKLTYLTNALKAKGHYGHIAESLQIYYSPMYGEVPCLCCKSGPPPSPKQRDSDDIESLSTHSPKSTPITSTHEDENTTQKKVYESEKSASFRDSQFSTVKTRSTSYNSEITVKPNKVNDDDFVSYEEQDNALDAGKFKRECSSESLISKFVCTTCCRKKRNRADFHAKIIYYSEVCAKDRLPIE